MITELGSGATFNPIKPILSKIIESSNHQFEDPTGRKKVTRDIVRLILEYAADLKTIAYQCHNDPMHVVTYQHMLPTAVSAEYDILISTLELLMRQFAEGTVKEVSYLAYTLPFGKETVKSYKEKLQKRLIFVSDEGELGFKQICPKFDVDYGNLTPLSSPKRKIVKQYRQRKQEHEKLKVGFLRDSRLTVYWLTSKYAKTIRQLKINGYGIYSDVLKTAHLLHKAYHLTLQNNQENIEKDLRKLFRNKRTDFECAIRVIDCLTDLRWTSPYWHRIQIVSIETLANRKKTTPSMKGQLLFQAYRSLPYLPYSFSNVDVPRNELHNLIKDLISSNADINFALDESGRSMIDLIAEEKNGADDFKSYQSHLDYSLFEHFELLGLFRHTYQRKKDLLGPIFEESPKDTELDHNTKAFTFKEGESLDLFFV